MINIQIEFADEETDDMRDELEISTGEGAPVDEEADDENDAAESRIDEAIEENKTSGEQD